MVSLCQSMVLYLEFPVSIFSAWVEISAFAGYSARGCFFRLKGFWPRLLDINKIPVTRGDTEVMARLAQDL